MACPEWVEHELLCGSEGSLVFTSACNEKSSKNGGEPLRFEVRGVSPAIKL
jgi:hypothetical protein